MTFQAPPTYTAATSGIGTPGTTTYVAALVPTQGINTKKVLIQQIVLSIGSTGTDTGILNFGVGRCSAAAGGGDVPIIQHDLCDPLSSMSFFAGSTSIPVVPTTPAALIANVSLGIPTNGLIVLTAADFPGGKPITLRNGQSEGLYFSMFNVTSLSVGGATQAVVYVTWTEE